MPTATCGRSTALVLLLFDEPLSGRDGRCDVRCERKLAALAPGNRISLALAGQGMAMVMA